MNAADDTTRADEAAADLQFDLLHNIIAYEQGELDEDEFLDLFAYLISTGLARQLQGHYGRTAAHLIQAGLIDARGNRTDTTRDDEADKEPF